MKPTTADFDYALPEDRIAAFPTTQRDGSRLLCLPRHMGQPIHSTFARIGEHLPPRSLIVLNDTRVIPARLRGRKPTGGAIELLLTRRLTPDDAALHSTTWEALGRNLGWAPPGTELKLDGGLTAAIVRRGPAGTVEVRLWATAGGAVMPLLEQVGELPLPPYIEAARRRQAASTVERSSVDEAAVADRERYQTVFATAAGAVAAPTAGLHFTEALLAGLSDAGHRIVRLTLHVGPGTFRPVKTELPEDHQMELEWYSIPEITAAAVNEARRIGRKVVAVGTTVVRALESSARENQGQIVPGPRSTRLFLRPGEPFHVVTDLLTNFHLPRSTLLMLVCAFAGRERVLSAYAAAVAAGYRFYSYGDATLIRSDP